MEQFHITYIIRISNYFNSQGILKNVQTTLSRKEHLLKYIRRRESR